MDKHRMAKLRARALSDSKATQTSPPPAPTRQLTSSKRKNGETLVVEAQSYLGKDYINIREWYADSHGELKPTKKGINLSHDEARQLLETLVAYFGVKAPETSELVSKNIKEIAMMLRVIFGDLAKLPAEQRADGSNFAREKIVSSLKEIQNLVGTPSGVQARQGV